MFDRRLLVTCIALLAVVAGAGGAVLLSHDCSHHDYDHAAQVVNPLSALITAQAEPEYLYIIREYEGRVAVFARGQSTPEMILERLVHHLPSYDRIQLREGVFVFSEVELQERIEDYTS